MAKCELCGKEMLESDGCSYGKIKYQGELYARIKYGEEFIIEEHSVCKLDANHKIDI